MEVNSRRNIAVFSLFYRLYRSKFIELTLTQRVVFLLESETGFTEFLHIFEIPRVYYGVFYYSGNSYFFHKWTQSSEIFQDVKDVLGYSGRYSVIQSKLTLKSNIIHNLMKNSFLSRNCSKERCIVFICKMKNSLNNFSFRNSHDGISSYTLGASKTKSSGSSPVASGTSRKKSTQKTSSSV